MAAHQLRYTLGHTSAQPVVAQAGLHEAGGSPHQCALVAMYAACVVGEESSNSSSSTAPVPKRPREHGKCAAGFDAEMAARGMLWLAECA